MTASITDTIVKLLSIYIARILTPKKGFTYAFIFTMVGSICLLLVHKIEFLKTLTPLFVLLSKAGMTVAFAYIYFAPFEFFKSQHMGLVIGSINFLSRTTTIAAPMIAEMGDLVPMASVITMTLGSAIGS